MALEKKQKWSLAVRSTFGIAGLCALIVGFLWYSHNSALVSICSNGVSQLGSILHNKCAHADNISDLGIALAVIGFVALFFGGMSARAVFTRDSRAKAEVDLLDRSH